MRSDFDLSFFVLGALTVRGPGEGLPTGGQLRAAQRQGGCLKSRESAAEDRRRLFSQAAAMADAKRDALTQASKEAPAAISSNLFFALSH